MTNILIIGATSAIAQSVARVYATQSNRLCLVARNEAALAALRDELTSLGAPLVATLTFDALNLASHQAVVENAISALGSLDSVLIAHGELVPEPECAREWKAAERSLTVNFCSAVALLIPLANYFEARRSGNITVISSVAGDRGRGSNYTYGAAKAGLSAYLQGLRNRLAKAGVSVTTIKPGFVDTPMTKNMKKSLLFASPDTVARRIVRASQRGEAVVYTPFFWRFIMGIIVHIPECIFKRMSL
jgi:decaprenylphospho-beta-D-erythro-pentofuranosid-2-ulose 2-reductase